MSLDGDLHKCFKTYLPFVDWNRIECGDISPGNPDLNGCYNGKEVWIENKCTKGWKIHNMRSRQVGWIERRVRHGGRVFIAVRQLGLKDRDNLWILSSAAARFLIDGGSLKNITTDMILFFAEGGPKAWEWRSVGLILFHEIPRIMY